MKNLFPKTLSTAEMWCEIRESLSNNQVTQLDRIEIKLDLILAAINSNKGK